MFAADFLDEFSPQQKADIVASAEARWSTYQHNMERSMSEMIGCDPESPTAMVWRQGIGIGVQLAGLARGGMGNPKGMSFANPTKSVGLSKMITKEGIFLNRGAENVNAGINLTKKLSQLEVTQNSAANIRFLYDGRIRYYGTEKLAFTKGLTRGRSYVTEFDPNTGRMRTWMECYDHAGKVNRVHPKQINGQDLFAPHYPPTAKEINMHE